MGRLCNGSSDNVRSASSLTLGSPSILSLSFWLWWDTFGNDGHQAVELSNDSNSVNAFTVNPNESSTGTFAFGPTSTAGGYWMDGFTRPTAGAWHHYLLIMDRTNVAVPVNTAYMDGSPLSLSIVYHVAPLTSAAFDNNPLNLMSRGGASLFSAGRIADVALWNVALTSTDATDLNAGTKLPSAIPTGLVYYWKLCGTDSPELPTTGAVNMTVTGATQTAHPSAVTASCVTVQPPDTFVTVQIRPAP